MPLPGRGLYAITDGPRADLLDACAAALAGGARAAAIPRQERRHGARAAPKRGARAAVRAPRRAADRQRRYRAGAGRWRDGVHLGEDDDDIASRASRAGRARDHRRVVLRLAAARAGRRARRRELPRRSARSFPRRPSRWQRVVPIDLLRQSAALGVPRVAIGGITPDNGALADRSRRRYLAAISAVFGAADVRAAAQRFRRPVPPSRSRIRTMTNHELFQRALQADARRRQLAGARVQVGRRRAVLHRARGRRVPVGRRRQALHRLRRLVGADDRRPQPSARARGGRARGAATAFVRHAVLRPK